MKRTFKYRIYPNKSQETKLKNTFNMCRHLYNWSLTERNNNYQFWKHAKTIEKSLEDKLPEMKKERPWFKGVHSRV